MTIDLRPPQDKIQVARDYLQEYFEDSLSPSLKAKFRLAFLGVDRASVHHCSSGQTVMSYRLAFLPGGEMVWRWQRRSGVRVATIKVEKEIT